MEVAAPAPGGGGVGEVGGVGVQDRGAGDAERAPRGGAHDAVDFEAVGGLEVAHRRLGGGAEFAVRGDVQRFLQAPRGGAGGEVDGARPREPAASPAPPI